MMRTSHVYNRQTHTKRRGRSTYILALAMSVPSLLGFRTSALPRINEREVLGTEIGRHIAQERRTDVFLDQGRHLMAMGQLDPARARLRGLFVSSNRQGQGLGRLMLSAIEEVATSYGLPELEGAMSLNAQGFYRHAGFAPVRPVQSSQILGVPIPVQLMRKVLQNVVGGK